MRIAVVTTSYPRFSGDPSGHFVESEVLALRALGHEVSVIAPKTRWFASPGIAENVSSRPWVAPLAAQSLFELRREWIALGPFERTIAHWALPSAWILPQGASPLEIVSHGADVRLLISLPRLLRNEVVARLAERSSKWRFVSQPLLEGLLKVISTATASLVTSRAVVEASPLTLPRDEKLEEEIRARNSGRRYLVAIGRLTRKKRVDRAIRHAASMGRELVVIGQGSEQKRLERIATQHGARVEFLGELPRAETLAWLASADGLLFASRHEGLSTVCREARRLDVPVLLVD